MTMTPTLTPWQMKTSLNPNNKIVDPWYIKQIDITFSCICPVIDDEFHQNIVKVAVDQQGDSRLDPQTTLTLL